MAARETDSPALKSVELLRLFAKDGVVVRLTVFGGLVCAEIAMRAISSLPRVGVLLTLLCAHLIQKI